MASLDEDEAAMQMSHEEAVEWVQSYARAAARAEAKEAKANADAAAARAAAPPPDPDSPDDQWLLPSPPLERSGRRASRRVEYPFRGHPKSWNGCLRRPLATSWTEYAMTHRSMLLKTTYTPTACAWS